MPSYRKEDLGRLDTAPHAHSEETFQGEMLNEIGITFAIRLTVQGPAAVAPSDEGQEVEGQVPGRVGRFL